MKLATRRLGSESFTTSETDCTSFFSRAETCRRLSAKDISASCLSSTSCRVRDSSKGSLKPPVSHLDTSSALLGDQTLLEVRAFAAEQEALLRTRARFALVVFSSLVARLQPHRRSLLPSHPLTQRFFVDQQRVQVHPYVHVVQLVQVEVEPASPRATASRTACGPRRTCRCCWLCRLFGQKSR